MTHDIGFRADFKILADNLRKSIAKKDMDIPYCVRLVDCCEFCVKIISSAQRYFASNLNVNVHEPHVATIKLIRMY